MRENRLRKLLNEGKPSLGTRIQSTWPTVTSWGALLASDCAPDAGREAARTESQPTVVDPLGTVIGIVARDVRRIRSLFTRSSSGAAPSADVARFIEPIAAPGMRSDLVGMAE